MNSLLLTFSFLAAYGDGAYGTSVYGDTGTGGIIGGLAGTGYAVLIPIIVALSLLGAGALLLVRRWLRGRKKANQATLRMQK